MYPPVIFTKPTSLLFHISLHHPLRYECPKLTALDRTDGRKEGYTRNAGTESFRHRKRIIVLYPDYDMEYASDSLNTRRVAIE